MKENDCQMAFLKNVKETLDNGCDKLSAGTLSRLTQARYHALETTKVGWRQYLRPTRAPVTALFMALILVFVSTFYFSKPDGEIFMSGLSDVDILAVGDSPEFYTDLDFYIWLTEKKGNAG